MHNVKDMHELYLKKFRAIVHDPTRKIALLALECINEDILNASNAGVNNIEINLLPLYKILSSLPFFSKDNFDMFRAYIRLELGKHDYKFEEKQYQWDAYPNPILTIRW